MSFSSLNPADRMKASAMIGITVVLLIFIVHTVLGAVSKKPNANGAQTAAATAPAPGPPAPPAGPAAAGSGGTAGPGTPAGEAGTKVASGIDMFPMPKADPKGLSLADDPTLNPGAHDPFVPIPGSRRKPEPVTPGTAPNTEPVVKMTRLPNLGSAGRAPGGFETNPFGGAGSSQPATAQVMPVAAPPEPEIRLVGIVTGEYGIATVQVRGRTLTVRAGDLLAAGYRLVEVNDGAIVVRHKSERIPLSVGMTINEEKGSVSSSK
jgi:hypothetical protein